MSLKYAMLIGELFVENDETAAVDRRTSLGTTITHMEARGLNTSIDEIGQAQSAGCLEISLSM